MIFWIISTKYKVSKLFTWNTMKLPWNTMKYHETPWNNHEIPWNYHEIPWTSIANYKFGYQTIPLAICCRYAGDRQANGELKDSNRSQIEVRWCWIFTYIYFLPRTQMTLVLIGKCLVLRGWPSKIEVIGALGILYIYKWICIIQSMWQIFIFRFRCLFDRCK